MTSLGTKPYTASQRSSPSSSPTDSPKILPLPLTTTVTTIQRSKTPKSPRRHQQARVAPSKDDFDGPSSKSFSYLASNSEPYSEDDVGDDSTTTEDAPASLDYTHDDDADDDDDDEDIIVSSSRSGRRDILIERKPSSQRGLWTGSAFGFSVSSISGAKDSSFVNGALSVPSGVRDMINSRRRSSPGPSIKYNKNETEIRESRTLRRPASIAIDKTLHNSSTSSSLRSQIAQTKGTFSYGNVMIRFRSWMLPEVVLLTFLEAMAIDRLWDHLPASNIFVLIFIASVTPLLTVFRLRANPSKQNPPLQSLSHNNLHYSSTSKNSQSSILILEAEEEYYMVPYTDSRGYRDVTNVDDGFAFAMIYPVLLAAGALWETCRTVGSSIIPRYDNVQVLGPVVAYSDLDINTSREMLIESRTSLLSLMSINSLTLLLNIAIAKIWLTRDKIPVNNNVRFYHALKLSASISLGVATVIYLTSFYPILALRGLSATESIFSTFIYQVSFYAVSRLVRRGFTLGELAITGSSGVALCLEFGRLCYARWWNVWPAKTFRWPTPLISYMHVLIPGSFLIGFLLAPMLALSRHLAQRPTHRVKSRIELGRRRKLVAIGVYTGIIAVCTGVLGVWQSWILNGSNVGEERTHSMWWHVTAPWEWAVSFALFRGGWLRLGLIVYWMGCIILAIGGWTTRMAVKRRRGTQGERKAGLRLDLRRKFFHGLAVLMFVPGIGLDPAFTSLAFSLAFSVFTLLEYARFFALYPLGRPIHLFISEFIDQKDAGPVVLSHFYLLTGCAVGVWLEGSGMKAFAGVVSIGIGDSCASLIGKRAGGLRWPKSRKTVIGTAAFVLSVWLAISAIHAIGLGRDRLESGGDRLGVLAAATLAGLLEASSRQNDNLVVPIYLWLVLCLMGGRGKISM